MWNRGCLGCGIFGMGDVRDVRCWGCEMFWMLNVGDVGCSGCGIEGMWNVRDVCRRMTKCPILRVDKPHEILG